MKFKKVMLIALLLTCLLTMSAVSATSDNDDALASDTNGDYTTSHDTSTNGGGEDDNSKTILTENKKSYSSTDNDLTANKPKNAKKTHTVVTDDNLTANDEGKDAKKAHMDNAVLTNDDEELSPYEEDGFSPRVPAVIDLESENSVVKVNTPNEGNFSISVTHNKDITTINHEINDNDVEEGCIFWSLEDLNMTEIGTYFLSAKFINTTNFNEITLFKYNVTVTEEPIVSFAEEFSPNDGKSNIVSINCLHGFKGIFKVECYFDDDGGWEYLCQANHTILDSDWGKVINFTVSQFDKEIEPDQYYKFEVYLLSSEYEDYEGRSISSEEIRAFDSSRFNIEINDNPSLLFNETIVSVWCPEGETGVIKIAITKEGEEEPAIFSKDISPKDWIKFGLFDLNIDSICSYQVEVYINETSYDDGEFEVRSPFDFSEVSYLNSNDEDALNIVVIHSSSDIKEGSITIKINGTTINLPLSNFVEDGSPDSPYWRYFTHMGQPIEDHKMYFINNKNIGYDFNEGIYEISATVTIDGMNPISEEANVTFVNSNIKTNDGVSIEIFNAQEHYFQDEDMAIILITAPEDVNAYVMIKIHGQDVYSEGLANYELRDGLIYGLIYPVNLNLDVGTYELNVTVYNNSDNSKIVENIANITLNYGEDGFMGSDVRDDMDYYDEWGINLWFAKNDASGLIVIEADGIEYYRKHIDSSDFDPEDYDEDGKAHFHISPADFDEVIKVGHYDTLTIHYYGDNGVNDTDVWENINIKNEPEIFICWNGENQANYMITDDNLVHIYPKDDDVYSVRIVVTIDEEEYLNATLAELFELNLKPNINDQGQLYYTVGPVNFNKPMKFGHYNNVVAYYYSDDYQIDTKNQEWDPNFVDIIGMIDEVEYNDTETDVIAINPDHDGKIRLDIRNNSNGEWLDSKFFNCSKGEFLYLKTTNLTLPVGNYYIEAHYNDTDDWIFDGNLLVVNKSKFYVKSECDWLYTSENVFWVWCPEDGEGLINITNDKWYKYYQITDDDKRTYIGFNLTDLGISFPGWYNIVVKVDDTEIANEGLDVPDPILMPGTNVYLPEDGFDTDKSNEIATLELPSDASGTISVIIDGIECFRNNINDFSLDNIDFDGNKVIYKVYTNDLDIPIKEGIHYVLVKFNEIQNGRALNFMNRTTVTENGISIIILNGSYYADWGDVIAEIIAPMGANGEVVLRIDGEKVGNYELGWECERYDEKHMIHYIKVYHLEYGELGEKTLNVTYEDISNEGTVLFMGENRVNFWNNPEEYLTPDDELFHIYSEGQNGRVVITADGKEVLNKTLDKLTYEDNRHIIKVTDTNLVGHFENVTIAFYNETEYSYNIYRLENGITIIDPAKDTPNFVIGEIDDVEEGSDVNISITCDESFNGNVTVKVGNKYTTTEITNGHGTATVSTTGLYLGENSVTVISNANGTYNAGVSRAKFTITAKPIDPNFIIDPIGDVEEGSNITISITADGDFTGTVNVQVGTINTTANIENGFGEVTVSTNGLTPGVTTVTVSSEAFDGYAAGSSSIVFNIVAKAKPNPSDNGNSGTNSGSGNSDSSGTNPTVQPNTPAVTKVATKIVATKKTFKAKLKTKKYTITLKTKKGKVIKKAKVTLKIGKKTYTKRTNNKGKATFKITKFTKRGKYKATIRYAGNKTYTASTKKVKITIK